MDNPFVEHVYTVGELTGILHRTFQNPQFQSLVVLGEIANKTVRSGHVYLDLTDPDNTTLKRANMRCILWASTAQRIGDDFGVGDVIQVKGGLDFYAGNSSLSLIANSLRVIKSKEGKNLLQKKKLLERLDKAGYLDPSRKRPIPRFVDRLAIISSSEAAGYHDILNTLARRYPTKETPKLFPAIVQGASAPSSIVEALKKAYEYKPDVLIIARGGGSKNDLSCFDEEKVVAMILKSPCPVITAIGHQIDVSVADRVADKTAITPTDAANCINPSLAELSEEFESFKKELVACLEQSLTNEQLFLSDCAKKLMELAPNRKLKKMEMDFLSLKSQFLSSLSQRVVQEQERIKSDGEKVVHLVLQDFSLAKERAKRFEQILSSTSLQKTLERGFSYVCLNGKPVQGIEGIQKGDKIVTTMKDGELMSVVSDVKKGK